MSYPIKHPADCKVCAEFDARVKEIHDRGFDSETAIKWAMHESALGRRICFHVFVGVPEWETTGTCSSCYRPPWAASPDSEFFEQWQATQDLAKPDHDSHTSCYRTGVCNEE